MTTPDPGLFTEQIQQRYGPAHNRTATSRAAADRVRPNAATMRAKVLTCVEAAGEPGITRQEIADELGMRLQTVCGRANELLRSGDVYELTDRRRDGRKILRRSTS